MNREFLSLIIPTYNGQANLKVLYPNLTRVLAGEDYELIFINDGSTDHTKDYLGELAGNDSRIRVINFPENRGQYLSFITGLSEAKGDILISIDDDWEKESFFIPKFIEKIRAGYDIVFSWRRGRKRL